MTAFPHEYALYGVTVRSNRPLPGMAPAQGDRQTVTIDFAGPLQPLPDGEPFRRSAAETLWHLDERTWLMRYDGPRDDNTWTIRYDDSGSRMTVRWDGAWLLDDIPVVIQGPGVSVALHMLGVPQLHACGIEIDGGAVLIMGAGGAGKSTTAAAFLGAGFPLVTDDIAPLDIDGDGIRVRPGYPRLRLFVDSAAAAGFDAASLPRVFATESNGDKRFIELAAPAFRARPIPLRSIYLLQPRRAGGGEPRIEAVPARAALPVLMRNVFLRSLLDPPRRDRTFRAMARVAESIPLRTVRASDDLSALPRLVAAIVADALQCRGAAA